jgi:glycolate oxidase
MEADLLMTARRLALPALERLGSILLDDVAVPLGRIPDLLDAIQGVADRHGVLIGTFGHAGDGNMHPTIVFDHRDPEAVAGARSAFEDIVRAALGLGGTITGEHGVGILKRPFLHEEIGEAGLEAHRRVKRALDPLGILNPGKVL